MQSQVSAEERKLAQSERQYVHGGRHSIRSQAKESQQPAEDGRNEDWTRSMSSRASEPYQHLDLGPTKLS